MRGYIGIWIGYIRDTIGVYNRVYTGGILIYTSCMFANVCDTIKPKPPPEIVEDLVVQGLNSCDICKLLMYTYTYIPHI